MDLRTEQAFWLMKNGYHRTYPALRESLEADVVVLGAGITGALAAYALAQAGLSVTVLDKRHPGMGSTAASTALLQYEIDEPLHSLAEDVGRKNAEAAYLACAAAIDAIAGIVKKEKLDVDFSRRPSLLHAARDKDAKMLEREYAARKAAGLDVELLDADAVRSRYGFTAPAGLWSRQAAQVDAYRLAHGLLSLPLDNLRVYDQVAVRAVECGKKRVKLLTGRGVTVSARRLVIACGYESKKFLRKQVMEMGATYAFASKPVDEALLWKNRALLWNTKDPYLYMRTTGDNRVIVGGRDDDRYSAVRRDRNLRDKIDRLLRDAGKLFPDLPLVPDFRWAGAFGGTADALPYIGSIDRMPNTHFILGLGGNGIVFSQTGAEIIRDEILGRRNPMASVYRFDR